MDSEDYNALDSYIRTIELSDGGPTDTQPPIQALHSVPIQPRLSQVLVLWWSIGDSAFKIAQYDYCPQAESSTDARAVFKLSDGWPEPRGYRLISAAMLSFAKDLLDWTFTTAVAME